MKSRIPEKKNKDSNILLSIGLIVKNEGKVLRRCLESLKPLLNSISCELIIADTGSSDDTVSIAREFTPEVYNFGWINDFAAARNSTLERANGKWYMYIDADEYFDIEAVQVLIKFFSTPELCENYNTIEYTIRNYYNEEKTEFGDTCVPRMYRMDNKKIRFTGKIHETIEINEPCGILPAVLHHTGYCFENVEQKKAKNDRNYVLMEEEYMADPENHRILVHLIDTISDNEEKYRFYVEKAENLLLKNIKDFYNPVLCMQCAQFYLERNSNKTLEITERYFKSRENADKYIVSVAMYYLKAKALLLLSKYDEAYFAYLDYIRIFEKYRKDELDVSEISAHPVIVTTERDFSIVLINASEKFLNESYCDKAEKLMEYVNCDILNGKDLNYYICVALYIPGFCSEINLRKYLVRTINDPSIASEILYRILKNKYDISDIAASSGVRSLCSAIEKTAAEYQDFSETVLDYGISGGYFNDIKGFYFIVTLYYEAIRGAQKIEDIAKKYELYSTFISLLGDYVSNIYNPELLNDNDIEVLPELHRFGYYMIKANKSLEDGDKVGYIRGLKNALINCESMKDVIKFLLEIFQHNIMNT